MSNFHELVSPRDISVQFLKSIQILEHRTNISVQFVKSIQILEHRTNISVQFLKSIQILEHRTNFEKIRILSKPVLA